MHDTIASVLKFSKTTPVNKIGSSNLIPVQSSCAYCNPHYPQKLAAGSLEHGCQTGQHLHVSLECWKKRAEGEGL